MSVSYGFYNSVNHDRKYDAIQISRIFDGIITDGVYHSIGEAFSVNHNSGLTVNVSSGRAWFDHTWTYNDAIIVLQHNAAHQVHDRIDAVVLQVNETSRTNSIIVKEGTASSAPSKPSMTDSDEIHEHPLAYVTIRANATDIASKDINYVVGTSECPFVAGVQNGVDIDALVRNWTDEFDALFAKLENQITQAVSGTLIDGSVSFDKLAPDAVRRRYTDVSVLTSAFVSDSTYSAYGYSYRAAISLGGVDSSFYPDVIFSLATLDKIGVAPIAVTYDGGVYIYTDAIPSGTLVIPVITCWR